MIKQLNAANSFMQSKTMSYIDWVLSIGVSIYATWLIYSTGLNFTSCALAVCGAISLVFAYIKPAKIIQKKLENIMIKRMKG